MSGFRKPTYRAINLRVAKDYQEAPDNSIFAFICKVEMESIAILLSWTFARRAFILRVPLARLNRWLFRWKSNGYVVKKLNMMP